MRFDNITNLLCLSSVLLFLCINSQSSCPPGWIGAQCEYICRCVNDSCDKNGTCTGGFACQGGWFGRACQYVDVAYLQAPPPEVTDGDDSTCSATTSITIPLNDTHFFTWMRVVISDQAPAALDKLTVTFSANATPVDCDSLKTNVVDKRTVDLHCSLTEEIDEVTLNALEVSGLCSVYVSGGCNFIVSDELCNEMCSENCFSPTNTIYCNSVTGACLLGCKTGFQGEFCEDECPAGKFGANCNSSCSPNCMPAGVEGVSPCEPATGNCRKGCRAGFFGSSCLRECRHGKFGANCNSSCSPDCKPTGMLGVSLCDPFNGSCRNGCRDGFSGNPCVKDAHKSVADNSEVDTLGTIVTVCMLFAAIVFSGYCLCKRRTAPPSAERKAASVHPELLK
ncbi:hypothetical protein BsWGS_24541 [Bradybaena similaris]